MDVGDMEYKWRVLPNATKKTPPIRCNLAGGVHHDHLFLLMGAGAGSGRSNEVWRYSLKHGTWEQLEVNGEVPTARDGHSATYVGNGKFLLFGGQGVPTVNAKANKVGGEGGTAKVKTLLAREVFNDVTEFDCDTLTWAPVFPFGTPPISRRLHTANFVSYGGNGGAAAPRATQSPDRAAGGKAGAQSPFTGFAAAAAPSSSSSSSGASPNRR